jgi:two-component system response regulator YesN
MWKVVIIDDEPYVIEGLKIMINWEHYGFYICGEAFDGEAGLEMIKREIPHLVIIDIRMPVMDGLSVIKHCRDLKIPCEFIILSGYSEFSFIKTAMQLQSNNYLLKPIDAEELHKILENYRSEIYKRQEINKKIDEDINFITTNSIIRILKGEQKDSLIKRINFILNLAKDERVCCILLEFADREGTRITGEQLEHRRKELDSHFKDESGCYTLIMNSRQLCMIVTEHFLNRHNNKHLYFELSNLLLMKEYHASLYIGDIHNGICELKNSYDEANISKKHQFYKTFPSIIEYKTVSGVHFETVVQPYHQQKVLNAILRKELYQIRILINELFQIFRERKTEPSNVFMWVENIKAQLMIEFIRITGDKEQTGIDLIQTITNNHVRTDIELKKHLQDVLPRVSELFSVKDDAKDIMDEIEGYIMSNFSKNIKLSQVAEHFNFNSAYLGQLLQKKIGMSFNEYLNKIRIEKSKELLRRTNLRLNEISDAIGYNNPNYFVQKFKEFTGISPMDYRNIISE